MAEFQKPTYVPIRMGMEEDNDINPPLGTVVDAKNVRFTTAGAAVPRPRVQALNATVANSGTADAPSITGSTEDAGALFQIGNTDAAAMAGAVMARDHTSSVWEARGNYSTCLPVRKRESLALLADSYGYNRYGIAVNSLGHVAVAASQNLSAVARIIITSADGVPLFNGTVSQANQVAIYAMGAAFVVVTQDNGGPTISAQPVTYAAGVYSLGTKVVLGNLNTTTCGWDICVESSTVLFSVRQNAGASTEVSRFTYPGFANTHNVSFAVVGEPRYSIYSDSANVWVGFNNDPGATGNVTYRVYTSAALAVTLGATVVATSTDYGPLMMGPNRTSTANQVFACYGIAKAASPFSKGISVGDVSTTGAGTFTTFWHVYPRSKPGRNGRIWTTATTTLEWTSASPLGLLQSRNLLLKFPQRSGPSSFTTPFLELATDSYLGVPTLNFDRSLIPEVTSSTRTYALLPDLISGSTGSRPERLQVYEYETSDVQPWRSTAQCGATTLISGQPVELGAQGASSTGVAGVVRPSGVPVGMAHPLAIAAAPQSGGGSLTNPGTYTWVAVPEWIDPETGRLHRGEPSAPYTAALTGANNRVTLTILGLMVDPRCLSSVNAPTVAIYRTRANESQLRKETTYLTAQSCFAETITHVSTVADTDLGDFLYTEGGFVAFNLAPSARFVRTTESSAILGGLWDRRLLRKLRDFVPGEPAQNSDLGSWDIYLKEDCEGIAYQDGITYAFAKSAVYIITGDGPNDQGQGVFDPVRTLTSEVGTVNPASILETSIGVFFLSARGFMLIPRGGGIPQFIGRPVQQSMSRYSSFTLLCCKGSTVVPGPGGSARFLMTDGFEEKVWVYEFDTQAWSYDTFRDSSSGSEAATRISAIGCWNQQTYTTGFVAFHGRASIAASKCAVRELTDVFSASDSATVTSYVKFADMRPWGLAGWGRCQTVAFVMSELVPDSGIASVTGTVTPDGLSSSATTRTWASLANPGVTQTIYREIDCGHMQCSGFVVEWSSVRAGSSTLEVGPSLHGLALLTVPERGLRLLQPSER